MNDNYADIVMNIAKQIQVRRQELGISTTKFAVLLGVPPQTVRRWEDGANYTVLDLVRIASVLKLHLNLLLEEKYEKN